MRNDHVPLFVSDNNHSPSIIQFSSCLIGINIIITVIFNKIPLENNYQVQGKTLPIQ